LCANVKFVQVDFIADLAAECCGRICIIRKAQNMPQNAKTRFYEKIIGEMYGTLLNYASLRVGGSSAAADIVQDACLTAWEKIDSLMASPNPRGWMMNVLKNHIRKYFAELSSDSRMKNHLPDAESGISDSAAFNDLELSLRTVLTEKEMQIIELKKRGYKLS
jgi:DNA-directed RNA polymerase specialized sigma24 family protein